VVHGFWTLNSELSTLNWTARSLPFGIGGAVRGDHVTPALDIEDPLFFLETWNTEVAFDIFGLEDESSLVDGIDTISPDGKNEFLFGPILENGVIAVTVVWGIFSGPPFVRELVEWDSIFEDIEFAWSTAGEDDKMDFQNIATHELGHASGMGHPDDSCTEETMYRFAAEGEFIKRDLNAGDLAGIAELYE